MSYLTSKFKRAYRAKKNQAMENIDKTLSKSQNPFKGILKNKLINFLPLPPVVKLFMKTESSKMENPINKINLNSPFIPPDMKRKLMTAGQKYEDSINKTFYSELVNMDMKNWNRTLKNPIQNEEDLKEAYYTYIQNKYSMENIFAMIGDKITNWRKKDELAE